MDVASLAIRVTGETSDAEAKLNSLSDRIEGFAAKTGKLGLGMSAMFTAPIVAAGAGAFKAAADMERSMNVLQQVIGADTAAMEALNQQALQLGADTSFSAGEAANAMLELGKAGLDTQQIMGAIPGVMSLAAAGGVNLEQAASLAAASLNTFGLEATDVAYVADLMANAANASSASIEDLMAGMRQGGFAFDMAGQGIDDLAASLAILTNVGLTGSDAGTALKNAFMRMMNPTAKAKKVMRELGIEFYDANGSMKEMPEIIGMLNKAFAGMTLEQRDAALGTIFLSDGMKAFVPLLEEGQAGFEEYLRTVNRAGAASETADAFMGGLSGAVEYLSGALESAGIALTRPFLGGTSDLLRWVADMVTAFTQLDPAAINAALAFGAVLAAAGPVALAISGIATAVGLLLTPFGLVTVAAGLLAAGFAAIKAAAGDGAILSPATLKNVQEWPDPLAKLATWAIGAGAALTFLWNAFKPDEDVDAKQMQTLFDTVRMAFGDDTAQRLKDVAAGIDAFGKAIGNVQTAVEDTGWFSQDTLTALSELPGKLAPLALTLLGIGAGFTVVKQALTGWQDADSGMAALRTFQSIFGKEATDNLMKAATHITAIKDGVAALATTGDIQPLATALTNIGTALAGIATNKLTELKTALGGMKELGLSVDSNTGKLSIDLKQMVTGIQDAFKTAFSGEDATLFDATVITDWVTARKQDILDAFKLAFGAGGTVDATGTDTPANAGYVSEWVTARKQDLIDAFEAAFVGTTTTDATGATTAAPGYVTTWVDARKKEVGDALSTAFSGEDATLFDVTIITGWAQKQLATIQTELQKQFAGGTPLGDLANNLIAGFMTIQGLLSSLGTGEGEGDGPGKFATAVGIVKTAMDTLSTLRTDALTVATDAIANLASAFGKFATEGIAKVDATQIQGFATGIVDQIAKEITALTNADNLAKIGTAMGSVSAAIAAKLTEVMSGDQFATDIGASISQAAGAFAGGAKAMVDGFAGQIGLQDVTALRTAADELAKKMQASLLESLRTQLAEADWSAIGAAIVDGLKAAIVNHFANMPITEIAMPGPLGKAVNTAASAAGIDVPTVGDLFDPLIDATNKAASAQGEYTVKTKEQAGIIEQTLPKLDILSDQNRSAAQGWVAQTTGQIVGFLQQNWPFQGGGATVMGAPLAMAGGLAGQAPVEVPAVPVWDAPSLMAAPPLTLPAEVTEVTAAPGLSLDVPLVSLTGDASMGAASGIQAAANQLNSFQFTWPAYPEFTWPPLPKFSWPSYPAWKWPAIPAPSWLNRLVIPRPSWLGELLAWSPTVTVAGGGGGGGGGGIADGTPLTTGGTALATAASPIVINATVAGSLDLEALAQRVAEKIRRR